MVYTGKATSVGNSKALSFEKALFRSHPQFATGRFTAHVISDTVMLVTSVNQAEPAESEDDPLLTAWLGFIEADIARNPARLKEIDEATIREAEDLVRGIDVDLDAPLDHDGSVFD